MRKNATAPTKKRRTRTSAAKTREKKINAALTAVEQLKPPTPKAAKVISLLKNWLSDESGYDEETWPELKKSLDEERQRVGARRLFRG